MSRHKVEVSLKELVLITTALSELQSMYQALYRESQRLTDNHSSDRWWDEQAGEMWKLRWDLFRQWAEVTGGDKPPPTNRGVNSDTGIQKDV